MSVRSACIAVPLLFGCARGDDAAGSSDSSPASTSSPMSFGDLPPPVDPTTTTGAPDDTSGTTEPAPGTSSTSTTGGPFCGDHVEDPGEECDYGRDNSNLGPCTLQCTKATCGDGLVWQGVEQCDLGPANAKDYGGCTPSCEWAARCGDGNTDLGYEECDLGDLNGTGQEVDGKAPCSATCRWQGRIVFVSSATYTGDLGGISGAHLKCQTLAEAAGLANPQTFRAWLSDHVHSPSVGFSEIDLLDSPYILLNGQILAANFVELVETGPRTGLAITETGAPIFGAYVWTNTSAFGEGFSPTNHCNAWLSNTNDAPARLGYNALADEVGPNFDTWRKERLWTSALVQSCALSNHLYCFEDG